MKKEKAGFGPRRPTRLRGMGSMVLPLRFRVWVAAFVLLSVLPCLLQITPPMNLLMTLLGGVFAVIGLNPPEARWLRVGMNVALTLGLMAFCASLTLGNPLQAAFGAFLIGQMGVNRTREDAHRLFLVGLGGMGVAFLIAPHWWSLGFVLADLLLVTVGVVVLLDKTTPPRLRPRTFPPVWRLVLRAWVVAVIFSGLVLGSVRTLSWERFDRFQRADRTGISDRLTPGIVEHLLANPATAFRVTFDGAPPPREEWYWRGPVFYNFDGQTWSMPRTKVPDPAANVLPQLTRTGPLYHYTWTGADEAQRAAFLDPVLPNINLSLNREMVPSVSGPLGKPVEAWSQKVSRWPGLTDTERAMALQLPEDRNPQTEDMAKALREQYPDDGQYIHAVLMWFHQHLVYTTNPAPLGRESIDDFLFNTKEGFCAHIAGAMTVLLRDAGIPARIVNGYQGGHWNTFGKYWQVRQSDAHAWVEAFLPDRGGWVRFDPTAVVISIDDLRAAPAGQGGTWSDLTDWAGSEVATLSDIRVPDWKIGISGLALTEKTTFVILGVCVVLLGFFIVRLVIEFKGPKDALSRATRNLLRRLDKLGLPRNMDEGWVGYGERVAPFLNPELQDGFLRVIDGIDRVRYGTPVRSDQLKKVVRAIRAVKLARPKGWKKSSLAGLLPLSSWTGVRP
jgi:transglutaminase-like putative cysteine protease